LGGEKKKYNKRLDIKEDLSRVNHHNNGLLGDKKAKKSL